MARQQVIPGTAEARIDELDDAGERLLKARNTRKKANERERDANDALVDLMKKHRRTRYELEDGFVVTLERSEHAKIKEPKPEKKQKAEAEAEE